jgi:hypothetical protein
MNGQQVLDERTRQFRMTLVVNMLRPYFSMANLQLDDEPTTSADGGQAVISS